MTIGKCTVCKAEGEVKEVADSNNSPAGIGMYICSSCEGELKSAMNKMNQLFKDTGREELKGVLRNPFEDEE